MTSAAITRHVLLTLAGLLFTMFVCRSQTVSPTADELFQQARRAAFDKKDYQTAIDLSRQALRKDPEYTDLQVFLGRLFTWTDQPDSARNVLEAVVNSKQANADAYLAYGSLEFWNDHSAKALTIVNKGLSSYPKSKDLLLLKAKILNDLNNLTEANEVVSAVLRLDPKNTEARALSGRIKDNSAKNSIGITYDFVHFDKQFADPWHVLSLDYGRQASWGSVIGRLNYGNRFNEGGIQYELDAYPRISNTFYAYVSGGYSGSDGVFPQYRAGFSLYANLPKSFEAEGGLRFLHFSDNTLIYTFSAGKYYKNYWFNFRTFLTPSKQNISQSYSLTARYYYDSADDYISLSAGTGISPDDNRNNVLLTSNYKLKSGNIGLRYNHAFKSRDIIHIGGSWQNQEYRQDTFGNQFTLNAGYQKRF